MEILQVVQENEKEAIGFQILCSILVKLLVYEKNYSLNAFSAILLESLPLFAKRTSSASVFEELVINGFIQLFSPTIYFSSFLLTEHDAGMHALYMCNILNRQLAEQYLNEQDGATNKIIPIYYLVTRASELHLSILQTTAVKSQNEQNYCLHTEI